MIMRKLKSVNIEEHARQMQNIAKERVETPKPIFGIKRTLKELVHSFDPSFVLDEDIYLPDGKLLHSSGTRVNPLDHMEWTGKLVFIDATDSTQIAWLKKQNYKQNEQESEAQQNSIMKIVLVAGRPIELEKELQTNVYFDQFGELTTKFNITQVPAVVEQNGKYLKITETYIGEKR
jgi:conjugal transfer pilus assembly protein TraW